MKTINVDLTDDQVEVLEQISKLAGRNSADFIKDTIFSLLPINEYLAIKDYLKEINNLKQQNSGHNQILNISNIIHDIEISANARLKRIGVL